MDWTIALGIIGILVTIFAALNYKKLLKWVTGQNKLRIEKLPPGQTDRTAEIIPADNVSAFLILPLRIVNPTNHPLTINEVHCTSVSHRDQQFDLIPPLTAVPGIDENQILDLQNVPVNKTIQQGGENVYLVRRCDGMLANERVRLKIVIKDHRNRRSETECEATGIFFAEEPNSSQ
jgi:hypothetical protein